MRIDPLHFVWFYTEFNAYFLLKFQLFFLSLGIYIDDGNATNVFNTDGERWPFGNYTFKKDIFIFKENTENTIVVIPKLSSDGCRLVVNIKISLSKVAYSKMMFLSHKV